MINDIKNHYQIEEMIIILEKLDYIFYIMKRTLIKIMQNIIIRIIISIQMEGIFMLCYEWY